MNTNSIETENLNKFLSEINQLNAGRSFADLNKEELNELLASYNNLFAQLVKSVSGLSKLASSSHENSTALFSIIKDQSKELESLYERIDLISKINDELEKRISVQDQFIDLFTQKFEDIDAVIDNLDDK